MKKTFLSLLIIFLTAGLYAGCSGSSEDVDTAPPEVTLHSPDSGASDIPVNSTVTAAFNKSVVGINGSNSSFTIQKVGSFGTLPANVSYNDTTFTATLDPVSNLEEDSIYVVTITDEVKSRNGIKIEPVSWTFVTKADSDTIPPVIVSVSPADQAKYVLSDTKVKVEFSEALQNTSIISENFYLIKEPSKIKIPAAVTISGTTVILSPDEALEDWTDYSVVITDGIKDIAGNSLDQISWTFRTDDQNLPVLVSKVPDGNDVATNAVVTVVFSESIKSYTIQNTWTSFILKKDFGDFAKIPASVIYNDLTKTATLTPGIPLEAGMEYKVILTDAIKDNANNAMDPVEWTFTTISTPDVTSPAITFRNPENNETGIATNPSIIVEFNENVTGVNGTNFILEKSSGGTVSAVVAYNNSTRRATLTPSLLLAEGTEYKVTLKEGVEDISGNNISGNTWTFVTRDVTRPVVASKTPEAVGNVGVNTSVEVNFSEKILSSTLSTSTFKVEMNGSAVSGEVTYNPLTNTAVFNPDADFQYNTAYTVTLTNGITDLLNNNLNTMSWSFSTGSAPDTTPPAVKLQDPVIDSGDVSVNTNITVTFSESVTGVSASNVALKLGNTVIPVQMNYDPLTQTATLLPDSALQYNTTYTVVVSGVGVIKDAAGNTFASNEQWNFTTAIDKTAPVVTYKIPAPGMPDIPGNTLEVTAMFSEHIDSGVDQNSMKLRRESDSSYVECSVKYTADTATNTYKAVMTPASPIINTGNYTVEMTSAIKDSAGNSVTAPQGWTFWITSIDETDPSVIAATPSLSGTSRWAGNKVQVVFSEDVSNINAASFYITPTGGSSHLSSVVTYTKGLLTAELVTDAVLADNTSYTAHLTSAITDRAGNPLEERTWTFITDPDTTSPTVTGKIPANGTNGVPVSSVITATFSEAIQNYDENSFKLDPAAAATVIYDPGSKTLTLDPTGDLAGNTIYTVYLTSDIKDAASNSLANISWQFTTQIVQDTTNPAVLLPITPADNAGGVSQSADVVIDFSEDVVNASSKISLSGNGSAVSANITYSNTGGNYRATLNPAEALAPSTLYTVTVKGTSTGIKDTSGNFLLADYVASFTTAADTTPPEIIYRDPYIGETGVSLKPAITITFNEPVTNVNSNTIALYQGTDKQSTYYVMYDSATRTATLVPNITANTNGNLSNLTTYTVRLNYGTTALKDMSGNSIASTTWDWSFKTTSLPVISSTIPAMNATGVSTDLSSVTLNFSQAMNPLKSWIEITDDTATYGAYPPVSPGNVTWSNGNATAAIALIGKLRAGAVYTVKLYGWGGTFEDLNGNMLDRNTVISGGKLKFTAGTDTTAPYIVSAIPAENTLNVGRSIAKAIIRFSEPMNTSSGAASLNGTVTLTNRTWMEGNRAVSFDIPTGSLPLSASTAYWIVPSGFKDLAGRNLSAASYFNTGAHTAGIDFTTGTSDTVSELLLNGAFYGESFENYNSPNFGLFRNVTIVNLDPPVNQTPQYPEPAAYSWQRTTCSLAYPNFSLATPDVNYIAKATDFLWESGDYADIELVNSVDLTSAAAYILSFKMTHERLYNRADCIEVHVSNDGGLHYTKLNPGVIPALYRYDYSMGDNNPVWQTHYFDLSGYSGSSSVKVILRGISAGETGGSIYIDDVRITKY